MTQEAPQEARIELPADVGATREARRLVATFDGLPRTRVADAQLVVSELVANAVLHAGLADEDTIAVALSLEGSHLRIEVDDRRGFSGPPPVPPPPPGKGGLGLKVVDALCESWEASAGRVVARIALEGGAG